MKNRSRNSSPLKPEKLVTEKIDSKIIKTKISENDCPMLNPKLPPVTDIEHNIRNCFCYMCTCGKHLCPADYQTKSLSHSSHFKTNYRLSYKKPVISVLKSYKRPSQYVESKFHLKNLSTSQSTYVPHAPEAVTKAKPETRFNPSFKFRGKSTYTNEYPNWGVNVNELPFKQGSNYIPNDLKINNGSQYQEAYQKTTSVDKNNYKDLAKSFHDRNWNSYGLLSPSTDFIGVSKMIKDYPVFPIIHKPKLEKNIDIAASPQSWKGQFISTYNGSYKAEPADRFLRKRDIRL